MNYKLNYFRYNESSVLISWPQKIDENILYDILNFKDRIKKQPFKSKVEVINAYNSILVIYENTIENFNDVKIQLNTVYEASKGKYFSYKVLWEIPVCYDDAFGFDITTICNDKRISQKELIRLHSGPQYTIFFLGFLPGFPYLGGLDSRLHTPRKSNPKQEVPAGSVAIGGHQTGIYTQNSPGGWHVIGKTPIKLFDPHQSPPCFMEPGKKLRFVRISKDEFLKTETLVKESRYSLKPINLDA
jgi:inhibitor of KinA